jgi:hypothetical protein
VCQAIKRDPEMRFRMHSLKQELHRRDPQLMRALCSVKQEIQEFGPSPQLREQLFQLKEEVAYRHPDLAAEISQLKREACMRSEMCQMGQCEGRRGQGQFVGSDMGVGGDLGIQSRVRSIKREMHRREPQLARELRVVKQQLREDGWSPKLVRTLSAIKLELAERNPDLAKELYALKVQCKSCSGSVSQYY